MNPSALTDFLPVLENWFGTEMARLYETAPTRRDDTLLMGCPVWGKKYLDRFQNYCLPSIVSQKNLGALAGRCHMVLFTDTDSFTRLWGMTKGLEAGGITIQLLVIPNEVMVHVPSDELNKYWILGVAGNVMLQMAGRVGMAFHMLQPDHIYAEDYFPNLFRLRDLGHEAIVQPGISAEISTAWEDIEPFRIKEGPSRGSLPIPSRALGNIGFKHLHKQTVSSLMNNATIPEQMPNSHLLVWQGRDKLVLHCCHMNPAYLSPRLCSLAQPRIPATLDAELPSFIGETPFYMPQNGEMTYVEVSDKDKAADEGLVSLDVFSERCWSNVRWQFDWMPYFERAFHVPIKRQKKYIPDDEIERQFKQVHALLIDANPPGAHRRFIPRLAFQR